MREKARECRERRAWTLVLLLLASGCRVTEPEASPLSSPLRTPSPLPDSSPAPFHVPPTSLPAPTEPPPPTPTPGPTVHVVQPGDTLLGLALDYGVPMAAIQLQNELGESTVIHAGAELTIPPNAGWEVGSPFWVVYVVEPGETLAGIAATYGLEVSELQTVNGLGDGVPVQAGQEIVLPLEAPAVAYLPTPTPPPTSTPTPAPTQAPTAEPTVTPTPPDPAPPAEPPADLVAWPQETFRIINQVRAQHGLAPFTYNPALAQAAQAHADDCRQRGWCSHTGSDGSDIKARILRTGYDPTGWAECWAWNRSPQAAVDMWMDEVPPDDPHRRTLLSTWLTEIGLGVAEAPSWGVFFIADFGRP